MNPHFDDNEFFLRAVLPPDLRPNFWRDGKLTSAAFKDKKGLSVDRTMSRTLREAAQCMLSRLQGPVFAVSVPHCKEVQITMYYRPSSNKYHCELHGSHERAKLFPRQARFLAKNAKYVNEEK